jgi:dTDP-glucose 4,6-dehydratase
MKKTALVTGGAGFIGSHICDYLIEKDFKVICMDNLITGSLENIEHIKNPDFIFLNHDITNFIDISGDLDFIFHFASPASPIDYLQLPIQTLKVGSLGTHNILGLAKAKRSRIILASTSEVYGDPKVHPQTEEYWGNVNPVGPRGVYDEAKRFAEALTTAYHKQQGLETYIVRIFNTYGPRMRKDDGRAVPTFISQCLENRNITVFGNGKQTRSFCYISDMVEGIYRLINSDYHMPLNLGNPEEMTIFQLAEKIRSIIKSKADIFFQDLPSDDPLVRKPDISKAKKILGWEPKVSFKDGIEKTISFFKMKITHRT